MENMQQKEKEIEQLKSQLIEARQKLSQQQSLHHPAQRRKSSTALATDSNPGPEGMDESKLQFLKQAVFHLLTDFHADDQLRAIISILDFSAQERKAVYAKTQEKKKATRGLY
jgi:tRNA-dihydrouridine synthase 3